MPAAATLLGAAALAAAPAASDRVELRFAWPEGTNLEVSYNAERERVRQGGVKSSSRTVRSYDLEVRRRGGELVIRRSNTELPRRRAGTDVPSETRSASTLGAEGKPVPRFDEVQGLLDEVVERIPVLVVTPDGEFRKTEETDKVRQHLDGILARSALPPPMQERVRSLFTASALDALAKEQWTLWVGMWRDLSLESGRPLVQRRRGVFPGTGYPIDLVVETRLEGFVPCPAPGDASCAELSVVSRADPEQVARTIERLELSGTAGIRKLSLDQSFTVVTRPETLLPHFCRRTLAAEIEHAPGSAGATRSEKLTESWAFDPARPPDRTAPAR
jgi:hypothetical protein